MSSSTSYTPSYNISSSTPNRPFRSRFLRSSKADYYGIAEKEEDNQGSRTNDSHSERLSSRNADSPSRKNPNLHGGVLNNGSVLLRMNSRAESSDEDSEEEERSNHLDGVEEVEEEEEEDPLDNANLGKKLFDLKTIKFKKNQQQNEEGVTHKFQKIANEISDTKSTAKEEEKKILVKRLGSSEINEVEQKDIQVRLQEILRDQKTEIEGSIQTIESHYEHILEETTTELTEIESSIRGKNQLVEKLQEEILSMNVRKEVLNEEIESLHTSHGTSLTRFEEIVSLIDTDISKYSVLVPVQRKPSNANRLDEDELKELEGELECPVCMDISRPPIYQCEEGHIICSTCKPLLINCPHCAKKYSEPPIRWEQDSPYSSSSSTMDSRSPSFSIHSDLDSYSPYSSEQQIYIVDQQVQLHSISSQEQEQQQRFSDPVIEKKTPGTDIKLQRLFDETLSNAKYEEISDFLHRYSELIDINFYDEDGQTPLQRFCQIGALPLVKLLIQYGANPGLTNREGWSPVHIASFSGNTELYSYIVRCNSNSLKR
ncbi:unnamed protein product [Lepeophtheirus salmonis]|uniref:(salmon louse) hypothetical protein n=1 Tax=Lepeophtheirus salmonis TaxID=72036 RepID=A0A7R8CGD8_LEPSM|nr:unnamed protein product [Lepeophtheirus salmonis]CAF2768361.1 unnamed protein product [Lepeophtheirus salmonis]